MCADQVSFGPFHLDLSRLELSHGDKQLQLGSRALEILCALVKANGELVTKDELLTQVWPGQIVEESNIQVHVSALRKALDGLEPGQSYVVTVPGRGYRFFSHGKGPKKRDGIEFDQGVAIPEKPSIAVLAFANLSGDPEQEYFADGVVEEIITSLSQLRWIFVIARNSSFTYKGSTIDVRQVGRELGVQYVLEGSVRKAGDRVRITAQLVDAPTGNTIWANRFDGKLDDIFDLQDQVTASVVGSIGPKLQQAEIERIKRKPTENLVAYDYFLKGLSNVHLWTKDANEEALRCFGQAIELDPNFAAAYGLAARCYSQRKVSGWTVDHKLEKSDAERMARRAAELGRDDPLALCTAGLGLAGVVGAIEDGAALIARSLELSPNQAWAWLFCGWARVLAGDSGAAVEDVLQAIRLSPQDPQIYNMQGVIAWAYFFTEQYDEAVIWAEKSIHNNPNYLLGCLILPASKALSGNLDEAREAMQRLRQLYPDLHSENLMELVPLRKSEDFARWEDGLKQAGLTD